MEIDPKEFEQEDPKNKGYSMLEIDFPVKFGSLAMRKNLQENLFEIFDYRTKKVITKGTLQEIINYANSNYQDHLTILQEAGK